MVARLMPGHADIDEVGYFISQGVEEVMGKGYYTMKVSVNHQAEPGAYLIREEDRKVYIFDTGTQKEHLVFDYALKAGDTYEAYSDEYQTMVNYEVLSVGYYTEGPLVVGYDYDEKADSMVTHYRYLRKWVVASDIEKELCLEPKTWIEGVGSLEGPLANLSDASFSLNHLCYVLYGDDFYLPFSFCESIGMQVHGCNLPTGAEYDSEDRHHQLTYELEGSRLHVYGKVFAQCGPNNYALFYESETDDPLVRKIEFAIQEVEPTMNCMALRATDFYAEGFSSAFDYIIVDNQGEEHPVINKTTQMTYRPFVEDGKVWKVGANGSGNPAQWVECLYFDGDTIIDGRVCKQMMRQRYVSPGFPEYDVVSQQPSLSCVGAWYEEDKKVYEYDPENRLFKMMYDFAAEASDTLLIDDYTCVIGPRQTGGIKGFKGVYRNVKACHDGGNFFHNTPWLEGVGGIYGPTTNVMDGELADPSCFLMSCTVGDEVVYLDDEYEDGATPEGMGARKDRIDFTHTIKIQPKAPVKRVKSDACISASEREVARPKVKAPVKRVKSDACISASGEAEQSIYGEYSNQQLGINLDPLSEAYLVRITGEAGKAVYEKAVNTGSIVGLNIDISAYAEGRYTVTVENRYETFAGQFETQTTGISDAVRLNDNGEMAHDIIYNLHGQRIRSLQKGLNIVSGQKVVVR